MAYSKDDLIFFLHKYSENNGGQTPKRREFSKDPDMPSEMPYRNIFGSWSKALRAAGFTPVKKMPNKTRKGSRNKKGVSKITTRKGYITIFNPTHPTAMKNGFCMEHRMLMYDAGLLNNLLDNVHHIDGNKMNNRLENLQVISRSEHTRIHKKGLPNPRKIQKTCTYKECKKLTGGRTGFCSYHYRLNWANKKRLNQTT